MSVRDRVRSLVYAAIDEINEGLLPGEQIEKSEDTILIGRDAQLDSMALVNLFVIVEGKMSLEFEQELSFLGEKVFSQENSPLHSIGSLIDYLSQLLQEKGLA